MIKRIKNIFNNIFKNKPKQQHPVVSINNFKLIFNNKPVEIYSDEGIQLGIINSEAIYIFTSDIDSEGNPIWQIEIKDKNKNIK